MSESSSPLKRLSEYIRLKKCNNPALRILLNKYTIATLFFLIWIFFIDNNNVSQWARTNRRLKEQQSKIESLKRDIENTNERVDRLQSQKDSIETFAREKYLFHEDSETVYIVK